MRHGLNGHLTIPILPAKSTPMIAVHFKLESALCQTSRVTAHRACPIRAVSNGIPLATFQSPTFHSVDVDSFAANSTALQHFGRLLLWPCWIGPPLPCILWPCSYWEPHFTVSISPTACLVRSRTAACNINGMVKQSQR